MGVFSSLEGMKALLASYGPLSGLVFFAIQMLSVIFAPIPSNVTMLAGALVIGFWPAVLLGVGAVALGSVIVFCVVRKLGHDFVARHVSGSVMEKYLPVIREKQGMFLFLTMLFPFFPDDAVCMLAGLTDMPFSRFLLCVLLGRPWGLIFAAALGSNTLQLPVWYYVCGAVVLILIFFFSMKYAEEIEKRLFTMVMKILRHFRRNQSRE